MKLTFMFNLDKRDSDGMPLCHVEGPLQKVASKNEAVEVSFDFVEYGIRYNLGYAKIHSETRVVRKPVEVICAR